MGEPLYLEEPENVLHRLQRGLAGYVSYLAACEMNSAFSEYVLYEPILRILTARGFEVECEVRCPNISHAPTGDKKKIDFVAERPGLKFAIEVKWPRDDDIDIGRDREKLAAFKGMKCAPEVRPRGYITRDHFGALRWLDEHDAPSPLSSRPRSSSMS